ncbi:MAG TPA: hypothetical protein VKV40_07720 [Ktedonobacteraceae bacterium]|nr:hypothetical protein [Ktedonobacteraceae bacterium]
MQASGKNKRAERILGQLKGLRERMQPDEEPLLDVPGIWDSKQVETGEKGRSMACDIVLTNQRLMGYAYNTFPRERLFLEAIPLAEITAVSLRHKTFEPLFRELLVRSREHKVYMRTSRRHIEVLYEGLRSAIEEYAPQAQTALESEENQREAAPAQAMPAPVYGRQDIRTSFENSSLAIMLLLIGGLALEVIGILAIAATKSVPAGGPLFFAGLLCVIFSIIVKRQQR